MDQLLDLWFIFVIVVAAILLLLYVLAQAWQCIKHRIYRDGSWHQVLCIFCMWIPQSQVITGSGGDMDEAAEPPAAHVDGAPAAHEPHPHGGPVPVLFNPPSSPESTEGPHLPTSWETWQPAIVCHNLNDSDQRHKIMACPEPIFVRHTRRMIEVMEEEEEEEGPIGAAVSLVDCSVGRSNSNNVADPF